MGVEDSWKSVISSIGRKSEMREEIEDMTYNPIDWSRELACVACDPHATGSSMLATALVA